MKTSEAFWLFLPEGMEELFDLVKVEKTEKSYDLWLDEKKHRSEEDMQNPDIVARGYTGTRLSAEFVSFLKDEGGDDGLVD